MVVVYLEGSFLRFPLFAFFAIISRLFLGKGVHFKPKHHSTTVGFLGIGVLVEELQEKKTWVELQCILRKKKEWMRGIL
jgi:hypothetical protein